MLPEKIVKDLAELRLIIALELEKRGPASRLLQAKSLVELIQADVNTLFAPSADPILATPKPLPKRSVTWEQLHTALGRSLKLQSHYASLLNMYDGGLRKRFPSVESWLERLKFLQEI